MWVLRGHNFACHKLLQGEETMGSFHEAFRRLQALGLGSHAFGLQLYTVPVSGRPDFSGSQN